MNSESVFGDLTRGAPGPGCRAILRATQAWPRDWRAYALATAWHETGYTLMPVMEHGSPAYFKRRYDPQGANPRLARTLGNTHPGDGQLYAGRGFVQLTGRGNYARLGARLSLPLEEDPDLALQPPHAARILAVGMEEGLFTGKRLADYFGEGRRHPVGARRIVNGLDRAAEIAAAFDRFVEALKCAPL